MAEATLSIPPRRRLAASALTMLILACGPREAGPNAEPPMPIQSARAGIVGLYAGHDPCPNAADFAGSWKLIGLPTISLDEQDSPISYELDITIKYYEDGEQPWVRVRGPNPSALGTFEGIATWGLNCDWIGVDSMTLRSAEGQQIDMLFLLSLAAGELRGLFAIYEDPRSSEHPHSLVLQGGAAAGREQAPKVSTPHPRLKVSTPHPRLKVSDDFEGFPCQLGCGLRHTAIVVGERGIGWVDSNGQLICEEEECR